MKYNSIQLMGLVASLSITSVALAQNDGRPDRKPHYGFSGGLTGGPSSFVQSQIKSDKVSVNCSSDGTLKSSVDEQITKLKDRLSKLPPAPPGAGGFGNHLAEERKNLEREITALSSIPKTKNISKSITEQFSYKNDTDKPVQLETAKKLAKGKCEASIKAEISGFGGGGMGGFGSGMGNHGNDRYTWSAVVFK